MAGVITWGPSHPINVARRRGVILAILLSLATAATVPRDIPNEGPVQPVAVIVQVATGAAEQARELVAAVGGTIRSELGIIDGFTATVPASSLDRLAASGVIRAVTPDGTLTPQSHEYGLGSLWGEEAGTFGTMANVNKIIGADRAHARGITGRGVDIALLDTGVVPVDGLTTNVINGPDLSFESQASNLAYLDTYGHGTHMAGIIAGRDPEVDLRDMSGHGGGFVGVAPGARLVSLKLATASGAVDVSQVIAAIDWVVQHRRDNDMNIRVINLSYGTDGVQDYQLDPLAYAADVAWRKGIVVVVAAGNRGRGAALNNPAHNPRLLAVGASDHHGTGPRFDDTVADFSSDGDTRGPDLVAPGRSLISLRSPGSSIDLEHPDAVVGERFFKGSGTSQAAAVVSGAAALVLQQRPWLGPDQVKALLMRSASTLGDDPKAQGAGQLDVARALSLSSIALTVSLGSVAKPTGVGSLELARGSAHVADDGVELVGERDIFGPWDGRTWARASWDERTWSGGAWNGNEWAGDCWCTDTWAGPAWSGRSWTGDSWAGRSWTGRSWTGRSWTGRSWTGDGWTGETWLGRSWTSSLLGSDAAH